VSFGEWVQVFCDAKMTTDCWSASLITAKPSTDNDSCRCKQRKNHSQKAEKVETIGRWYWALFDRLKAALKQFRLCAHIFKTTLRFKSASRGSAQTVKLYSALAAPPLDLSLSVQSLHELR